MQISAAGVSAAACAGDDGSHCFHLHLILLCSVSPSQF